MNEIDNSFKQVIDIIKNARNNAYHKVKEELVLMYMNVGKFLSEKAKNASYGDEYMESLASYIQKNFPGIKGFNRRELYRMKQFYELYAKNEKVSALLTQLSWTNHLLIMSGCKSDEEREFKIREHTKFLLRTLLEGVLIIFKIQLLNLVYIILVNS